MMSLFEILISFNSSKHKHMFPLTNTQAYIQTHKHINIHSHQLLNSRKLLSLCKKCPYSEFSGPHFPTIGLNTEQKNS